MATTHAQVGDISWWQFCMKFKTHNYLFLVTIWQICIKTKKQHLDTVTDKQNRFAWNKWQHTYVWWTANMIRNKNKRTCIRQNTNMTGLHEVINTYLHTVDDKVDRVVRHVFVFKVCVGVDKLDATGVIR